jgi:hypothetical protein
VDDVLVFGISEDARLRTDVFEVNVKGACDSKHNVKCVKLVKSKFASWGKDAGCTVATRSETGSKRMTKIASKDAYHTLFSYGVGGQAEPIF